MTDIATSLHKLGIRDWTLRGEPTTETEFNKMFFKVVGADDTGTAIESSDPNDFGVTWAEVSAKKTELENAEPLKLLRAERNAKLAETDWEIVMHKEKGTNIPAALKTYRQALRDITNDYTSLDDVVWPEKP